MFLVLPQMFDLDRDVVAQPGKLAVQRLYNGDCMPNAIEKIGIPKRDVPRPARHLLPHVFEHNFALHDAKIAFVHRHNRAVAAQMFAAPARFRVSRHAMLPRRENHIRILLQRWKSPPVRRQKLLSGKRNHRLRLPCPIARAAIAFPRKPLRKLHKPLLKLASQQRLNTALAQVGLIQRRIQAKKTNVSEWIQLAHRLQKLHRQPRCRMHRHIERHEPRRSNRYLLERLPRQIQAHDLTPMLPQPRRRRRQPKRLPPQLIRREQNDLHPFDYSRPARANRFRLS